MLTYPFIVGVVALIVLALLKPSSQYIAHDVSRLEAIIFSMGFDMS